jgi:hypothetical protein
VQDGYCGDDLVGYGSHPNEVCALIAEREIPTIYGKFDYAIARDLEDCGCAYITPQDRELGPRSVAWTLAHTDQTAKDFMRALPFGLRFQVAATDVHRVHGSPRKVNEYLFEDKPAPLRTPRRRRPSRAGERLVNRPRSRDHGLALAANLTRLGDGSIASGGAFLAAFAEAEGELAESLTLQEQIDVPGRLAPLEHLELVSALVEQRSRRVELVAVREGCNPVRLPAGHKVDADGGGDMPRLSRRDGHGDLAGPVLNRSHDLSSIS